MIQGVLASAIVPGTYIGSPENVPEREVEGRNGQVRSRFFGESIENGPWVFLISFAPGYSEPPHWHDFDTVYVPVKGGMTIGAEGLLEAGQVRWVRGGTYYGPEAAGEDGCQFWLIAAGPPGLHYDPPEGYTG